MSLGQEEADYSCRETDNPAQRGKRKYLYSTDGSVTLENNRTASSTQLGKTGGSPVTALNVNDKSAPNISCSLKKKNVLVACVDDIHPSCILDSESLFWKIVQSFLF